MFVDVVFSQLRSSQDDLFFRSCSPSFLSPQSLFIVSSRSLHRRVVSPRTTPKCEIVNDVTIHFRFVEDFSVVSSMSSGSSRCTCSEGTNFHLNPGSLVLHMIVMKYPSPHRTSSFKSRGLAFRLNFWWSYSELFSPKSNHLMSPQVFSWVFGKLSFIFFTLVLIQQVYLTGSSLGHLFRIFSSNPDLRIRSCSNDVNTVFLLPFRRK